MIVSDHNIDFTGVFFFNLSQNTKVALMMCYENEGDADADSMRMQMMIL